MSTPSDEPQRMRLTGIHHVTLVVEDLERTTAFYRDVLGLTLVRDGVSDDDPGARHVWFGDPQGSPGTLVSFLEYPSMDPGVMGRGSTHHIAFAVGSVAEQDAWSDWLASKGVPCSEPFDRGGLRSLYVRDPDAHVLEITVAH